MTQLPDDRPDSRAARPVDGHAHSSWFESTPALSVWATAQASPVGQRKDRYVPESTAHPAKMLPAIAAHAITHYTEPGELVLDPMCGIGTTLVEAVHAGRRTIGVEYEPHWATVADSNLSLTRAAGLPVDGRVFHGDARKLATVLPAEYYGEVALVVTSPPYGPSVHGHVTVVPGGGIHNYEERYGDPLDRGNLANISHQRLLAGFTRILGGAAASTARWACGDHGQAVAGTRRAD